MKFCKNIRMIAVLLLFVTFFSGITAREISVGRTNISDLENQMEATEKKIKEMQAQIENKNSAMAKIQSEKAAFELEMHELNTEIFNVETDIDVKENEILFTQNELIENQELRDEYYDLAKERIKVMYEHGSTEYIEVLLESKSTADLFNRVEYLSKIAEYDQSVLDQLDLIEKIIIENENRLRNEKEELLELKNEKENDLEEVLVITEQKGQELIKVENDKELLFEQIKEEEKALEEIDEAINKIMSMYTETFAYGDNLLSWPVPGYNRVSSYFGPRIHPVYGYKSTHTGIDIPAAYGVPVKASASGRVIFAGWSNVYGNYILMYHGTDSSGRNIITQYAHCSSLFVVEGDLVLRGDTIAKIGSTGWSTGNHLHYGVKVGGNWVNPLGRLDR